MTAVTRLSLSNFRNHADTLIEPGTSLVLLSGPNGAGKTNVLEALSLLSPGRGLRQVPISQLARCGGPGDFAVFARLDSGVDIGTGTSAASPDRRQARINGAAGSLNALGEAAAMLWLTPAMDRLFNDSAGSRRRFLDRLTLALEPSHAHHAARYEAAMRARNKLLGEPSPDEGWLGALEAQMGEHGLALSSARQRTVVALAETLSHRPDDDFPHASLALDGAQHDDLAAILAANRRRDAHAGRATEGPHRQDLLVVHTAKDQPAAQSSTGEQKALLLSIILAHGELVGARRKARPILLLDEVGAHLDPGRRELLFERLAGIGQVWMTATEAALFEGIAPASRFHVEAGKVAAI